MDAISTADDDNQFRDDEIKRFLEHHYNEVLFHKKVLARRAFEGTTFRTFQIIEERWPETESIQQKKLRYMLESYSFMEFRNMTTKGRNALWNGIILYFNLTEHDFPYPENLSQLDNKAAKFQHYVEHPHSDHLSNRKKFFILFGTVIVFIALLSMNISMVSPRSTTDITPLKCTNLSNEPGPILQQAPIFSTAQPAQPSAIIKPLSAGNEIQTLQSAVNGSK